MKTMLSIVIALLLSMINIYYNFAAQLLAEQYSVVKLESTNQPTGESNKPVIKAPDRPKTHTLYLHSSKGNGWNGTILAFRVGNRITETFGEDFTMGHTYSPILLTLRIGLEMQIEVLSAGELTEDISFSLYSSDGGLVYEMQAGQKLVTGQVLHTFVPEFIQEYDVLQSPIELPGGLISRNITGYTNSNTEPIPMNNCGPFPLPFLEDVSDPNIIFMCWVSPPIPLWYVSFGTNFAGGVAPELAAHWYGFVGISRKTLPPIDLSGQQAVILEFNYRYFDFNTGVTFLIQSSADGVNFINEPFTIVSGQGNKGPDRAIVPLSPASYSPNTIIALTWQGIHAAFDDLFLDNFHIYAAGPPPCEPPLVSVLGVGTVTATLGLTTQGNPLTNDLLVTPPVPGSPWIVENVPNQVIITDLTPNTPYTVQGRSVCDGQTSEWSTPPVFFQTNEVPCPNPQNLLAIVSCDVTEINWSYPDPTPVSYSLVEVTDSDASILASAIVTHTLDSGIGSYSFDHTLAAPGQTLTGTVTAVCVQGNESEPLSLQFTVPLQLSFPYSQDFSNPGAEVYSIPDGAWLSSNTSFAGGSPPEYSVQNLSGMDAIVAVQCFPASPSPVEVQLRQFVGASQPVTLTVSTFDQIGGIQQFTPTSVEGEQGTAQIITTYLPPFNNGTKVSHIWAAPASVYSVYIDNLTIVPVPGITGLTVDAGCLTTTANWNPAPGAIEYGIVVSNVDQEAVIEQTVAGTSWSFPSSFLEPSQNYTLNVQANYNGWASEPVAAPVIPRVYITYDYFQSFDGPTIPPEIRAHLWEISPTDFAGGEPNELLKIGPTLTNTLSVGCFQNSEEPVFFSFKSYVNTEGTSGGTIIVATEDDVNGTVLSQTITIPPGITDQIVYVTPIPPTDYPKVIWINIDGEFNTIAIDDLELKGCPPPSALIATPQLDGFTVNAHLEWASPNSSQEFVYEVEYGEESFSLGSGITIFGIQTNTFVVEDLELGISYDFYVRTVCGTDLYSQFIGPVSMSSPCAPEIICPPDLFVCVDSEVITLADLQVFPAGGTFSNELNEPITTFNPAELGGPGPYLIYYCYIHPQTGCEICCEFVIHVIPVQIPECPEAPIFLCINSGPFELNIQPEGGQYSSDFIVDNFFYPGLSGVGTFMVEYCYIDPEVGCVGCCEFVIIVTQMPEVACPPNIHVCIYALPVLLNQATPTGGVYSGPGVGIGGFFDPLIAGPGAHLIEYTYTDPVTGCEVSCTFVINVHLNPLVICPANMIVHIADAPFALAGALPPGGIYFGPGAFLGVFNPEIAGIGPHVITYQYVDAFGCEGECEFTITVVGDPDLQLDFGDAPEDVEAGFFYPTTLPNNGARHLIVPGIYLGNLIDGEADGQPSILADGDDTNNLADEDGLLVVSNLAPGMEAIIVVTVSANGYLDAWIDFNQSGNWVEAEEHVLDSHPVEAGLNTLTFNIPEDALVGDTYARFRYRLENLPLSYDGPALSGEVEDYLLSLIDPVFPGDANNDGVINVLDVITIINYVLGLNPDPFVFANADITGDGDVDILDAVAIINIILNEGKQGSVQSSEADIYLSPGHIRFSSDGTISGLQFEIHGANVDKINLELLHGDYHLAYSASDNKLVGIIISLKNKPFPAGMLELISIQNGEGLAWGDVFAANTNPHKVKVNKHNEAQRTEFEFAVFPNPNTGHFTIELDVTDESWISVDMIDMMGRATELIPNTLYRHGKHQLHISGQQGLTPGVYYVRLYAISTQSSAKTHLSGKKVILTK